MGTCVPWDILVKMSMSRHTIPQFAPHWERAAMKKEEVISSTRVPGAGPLQNPHGPIPTLRETDSTPHCCFITAHSPAVFSISRPFSSRPSFMFPKAPCAGFHFPTAVSPTSVSGSGFYLDSSESYFTRLCKSFVVEVQVSHCLLLSQDTTWDSLHLFIGCGSGASLKGCSGIS